MNLPQAKAAHACTCCFEPKGEAGLEGFQRGDVYPYQVVQVPNAEVYVRVWPSYDTWPNYYETCSYRNWQKYFRPVPLAAVQP